LSMPFRSGWQLSIESAKRLLTFCLNETSMESVCLRSFSQDHLEVSYTTFANFLLVRCIKSHLLSFSLFAEPFCYHPRPQWIQ
jgi:hypothetical protein